MSARFDLSAGENIGAGDASEFGNRQLWASAAGMSGVNMVIESLPLAYDTVLEDSGGLAAASRAMGRCGYCFVMWACLVTTALAITFRSIELVNAFPWLTLRRAQYQRFDLCSHVVV